MVGQASSLSIQNDGQPRVPRGASHQQSKRLKAKIPLSRVSLDSQ
jgi:hypothetical protein